MTATPTTAERVLAFKKRLAARRGKDVAREMWLAWDLPLDGAGWTEWHTALAAELVDRAEGSEPQWEISLGGWRSSQTAIKAASSLRREPGHFASFGQLAEAMEALRSRP